MKFPGVVAVLRVVSGLVLHIGLTYAPFPLGQKCPRKIAMIYDGHAGYLLLVATYSTSYIRLNVSYI